VKGVSLKGSARVLDAMSRAAGLTAAEAMEAEASS